MSFLKKLFFTLGFIFLVAVIFFFVFSMGKKIFVELDSDYILPSVSAFMGAFFAFLFLIIGQWFSRIYSRHGKHRNALVKLEYSLNEDAAITNRNIAVLKGLGKMLNTLPIMSMTTFGKIEVDRSILLELKNIDLINDLFKLNLDRDASNQTLHQITSWYNEVRRDYIDRRFGKDPLQQILANWKKDNLDVSLKFLELFQEKIKGMLSKVRVLLKSESFLDWLIKITSRKQNYPKNFNELLEKEKKLLDEEFEKVTAASKKEIQELFGTSDSENV